MRTNPRQQIIEHEDPEDSGLQDPDDFLDRSHPANDDYMKAVEHVQRGIMHANSQLRTKQVKILKSIFAGNNYTQTAKMHQTTAVTVSRLVSSPTGQRLLNLLQYHLQLIEGPNEAQRRSMLWRIALKEEAIDPKTSIKALGELNKMHYQSKQLTAALNQDNPQQAPQVVININQTTMPKGKLDA